LQSAPAVVVPRLARQQQEEELRNRASTRERPNSAHRFRIVTSTQGLGGPTATRTQLASAPAASGAAPPHANDRSAAGSGSGGGTQNIILQFGDTITIEAIDSQLPSVVEPALLEWLSKLRLLRYAPQLAALCTSLADAREMGVREIEGLGLKPLEALRMTKAVQALHNGGGGGEAPLESEQT
jgi:hypothetical protein